MADLVSQARDAWADRASANFALFVQVLAQQPIAQGAHNLLRDLSDQRRGGAALTALSLAAGLPEPDPGQHEKGAAKWLFAALLTGALGAEAGKAVDVINRLTEEAWDWIDGSGNSGSGVSHGDFHGDVLSEEIIHSIFH